MSIVNLILIIDLILLGITVLVYYKYSSSERKFLKEQASQSLELQQKIYQIQVLKEIGERIGYSLDTTKIIEIITSSLGTLLEYDTVSYMILQSDMQALFKCHVENTVSHGFVEQVRQRMLQAFSAILNKEISPKKLDESITGNILDDNFSTEVGSFFNLPVIISGKLVGLITVASSQKGLYGEQQASILYSITNQAATAVSKLQQILETEKGKLSAIIYSMTDGVLMIDLDNQLLVHNPAVIKLLELTGDKTTTMFDIVDALAGKIDIRTKVDQVIAEGKVVNIPELYIKDKALELTITPVNDQNGERLGASAVFHDVTSEKSLEKLRQEFTAMMVHELRAPLTAVRWSSESMLKDLKTSSAPPKKLADATQTIESAATNMLELVNDLLDVAKIEAGKFELNIQENDLVLVIQERAKIFGSVAQQKHLAINVSAPKDLKVKFDKVRIAQVLDNLISNAIKYTDTGEVNISCAIDKSMNRVVVAIHDSGVGVSREDLAQLFSKFKQLKSGTSSRKGTGLGLVVSKGIVDAHKGQIWAESAGENLGSTFSFSLPLN